MEKDKLPEAIQSLDESIALIAKIYGAMDLFDEGRSATYVARKVGLSLSLLDQYGAIEKKGGRWQPTRRVDVEGILADARKEMLESMHTEMVAQTDDVSEALQGELYDVEEELKRVGEEAVRSNMTRFAAKLEELLRCLRELDQGASLSKVLRTSNGISQKMLTEMEAVVKKGSRWAPTGKVQLKTILDDALRAYEKDAAQALARARKIAHKRLTAVEEGTSAKRPEMFPSFGETAARPKLGKGLMALIQDVQITSAQPQHTQSTPARVIDAGADRQEQWEQERKELLEQIAELQSTVKESRQTLAIGSTDLSHTPLGHLLRTQETEHPKVLVPTEEDHLDLSVIQPGYLYLLDQVEANDWVNVLDQISPKGAGALCISRTNPAKLQQDHDLSDAKLMWLTSRENQEDAISFELEILFARIDEMLEDRFNIVVLDGIEFLISNHRFTAVLNFIRRLVDLFSIRDNLGLIPIAVKALEEHKMQQLQREMRLVSR